MFVDRKVTELIDNQNGGLQVAVELVLETAGGLGRCQGVDDVHGGGEQHRVSIQAGGVAESDRQMRFAEADVADQDDVGLGCDEGQTEQVLDLRAVDLFGPAPLEVIEGFEHGEARVLDASLDAAVLPHRGFALNQLLQIIQVRALLLGGFGGQALVVALDVVQVQTMQLRVQSRQVIRGHDRLPRRHLRSGGAMSISSRSWRRMSCKGPGSGSARARVSRMLVMYSALKAWKAGPSAMARATASAGVNLGQSQDLADVVAGVEPAL